MTIRLSLHDKTKATKHRETEIIHSYAQSFAVFQIKLLTALMNREQKANTNKELAQRTFTAHWRQMILSILR
jgi:hypothetical protein